jgi:hypothetical protein
MTQNRISGTRQKDFSIILTHEAESCRNHEIAWGNWFEECERKLKIRVHLFCDHKSFDDACIAFVENERTYGKYTQHDIFF